MSLFTQVNELTPKRKRSYMDLLVNPKDIYKAVEMMHYSRYLGFRGIGLSVEFLFKKNEYNYEIDEIISKIQKLEDELGLQLIFKIPRYLVRKNVMKFLDPLKTIIYDFASNSDEFRKLLKTEANVIVVSISKLADNLKKSNINLLLQTEKAVEIIIKDLWTNSLSDLQRIIKLNNRIFSLLNKDLPIYVVSGAENIVEMRNPYQIRSFLALLGVRENSILKLLEERPKNVLEKTKPIIFLEK